jgi:4,4'-diaponeurosporenoate glycosyltransferase
MLYLVPILAILCAPALWLVLGRPRFVPAAHSPPPDTSVSLIIPARNEEDNIGALLVSIASDNPRLHEIIVVDDASTDRTAAIARGHGATVVSPPLLPDDWKGKPWACHNGASTATGDWLLFLDADTRLAPGGLDRIHALTAQPDRVHSICPYHTVHRPFEQLSAFFNIIMIAGINAFGLQRAPAQHAALFGQCLLISQIHYHQIGGHEPVRDEVLENFHLSRHLADLGIPRECHLGHGCLTMRMFPGSFHDLWTSWKKGFTSGASNVAPRALFLTSAWITGAMLAIVGVILAFLPHTDPPLRAMTGASYLLYSLQCQRAFRLAGNFSRANALLFPVSLLFYQTLFFTSLIERRLGIQTKWKGRHVD